LAEGEEDYWVLVLDWRSVSLGGQLELELETKSPRPMKPAEEVYRFWAVTLGKDPDLPMGKSDWSILGARFKEGFTIDQLKCVAVGALVDARGWPDRKSQNEIRMLYGDAGCVRKFIDLAVQSTRMAPVSIDGITRYQEGSQ
jgi:hypothetical protein